MLKHGLLFSLCCLVLCSAVAPAADFEIDDLQQRMLTTIETVKPAVVSLRRGRGGFSGVIVSKEGHILSAGHAVQSGVTYSVQLPDGRRLRAVGKGTNSQADCALLQITGDFKDLPFVRMGESKSLVRNQPCLSVSFPGGQGTRGVPVVRFGHIVRASRGNRMLQSTALMEPGDSGGALFDLQGRVIGIHSRIGRSMTRNYEVPIDTFRKFWNELNREQPFTQIGPPTPKLGLQGQDRRDGTGINVSRIINGSLADEHGIQPDDIIQRVYDRATTSISELREALIAARDEEANEIVVQILRDEEGEQAEIQLKVPFEVDRETAPEVELPDYEQKDFQAPSAINELANLPAQFSELESKLDDACVEIESTLSDGEPLVIVGTLISQTPFLVSKSSMVAEKPQALIQGAEVDLQVVARDAKNDLVLLKSNEVHTAGIQINEQQTEAPGIGRFLISPDFNGPGLVSIVSTKSFTSRKQQSRGYLGVMPADYKDGKGALLREVTEGGAAERAGLEQGDVVTQLDETAITTHQEMRRFLGTVDPNTTIQATIMRGEEQLTKSIRLNAYPSNSNHAADQMSKSGRRDGFMKVIPHDADLKPTECGGPLFDLDGRFVGLNIARNSRVRSYAIPRSLVREFVETKR